MKVSRALGLLALALLGCLILPAAAYVAGGRLIGAYAGPRGLATYINSLYVDAAAGSPLALILVTGPALIAAVWGVRGWLLRRCARPTPQGGARE